MDKTDLLVQVQKLQLALDLERQKSKKASIDSTKTSVSEHVITNLLV